MLGEVVVVGDCEAEPNRSIGVGDCEAEPNRSIVVGDCEAEPNRSIAVRTEFGQVCDRLPQRP